MGLRTYLEELGDHPDRAQLSLGFGGYNCALVRPTRKTCTVHDFVAYIINIQKPTQCRYSPLRKSKTGVGMYAFISDSTCVCDSVQAQRRLKHFCPSPAVYGFCGDTFARRDVEQ